MLPAVTDWILSTSCVVLATQLLLHQRCTCAGVLQCVCTTVECRRDGMSSCQARRMCYEQRMSDGDGPSSSRSPGGLQSRVAVVVVRGCIDDSSTPLLCRNQRPNWFSGSWPLLRCCTDDWCNRASLVAAETAASGNEPRDGPDNDDDNEYYGEDISVDTSAYGRGPSLRVADHPKKTSSQLCGPSSSDSLLLECQDDRELNPMRLNLLYVLVPVSGACALLALCATAFVVLNRGDSPQSHYGGAHRCSDVSGDDVGARRNVLRRDRLRKNLEKNAFGCHRKYNSWMVADGRKKGQDSMRTAAVFPQTYIDSRIFVA